MFQYFFETELIPSGTEKALFMHEVIGNKIGRYRIFWQAQCVSQIVKSGNFEVNVN